jgi:hypothetical protein
MKLYTFYDDEEEEGLILHTLEVKPVATGFRRIGEYSFAFHFRSKFGPADYETSEEAARVAELKSLQERVILYNAGIKKTEKNITRLTNRTYKLLRGKA